MKKCTLCEIEKELSEFSKNKHRKSGYTERCKSCRNKRQKAYLTENPEVYKKIIDNRAIAAKKFYSTEKGKAALREFHLQREYGITQEQYEDILQKQDGVCKICKKFKLSKNKKFMPIDHCHKTGKIRGILCSPCNKSLGAFEDNIETLQSAIDYLKESK